jgi:hypothetical protein
MRFSPLLVFHICAGIFGLLSGAVAMLFRKGSNRHRIAGDVFVIAMLGLSASGAYIGFTKQQILNGLMGVLTFYLVITAWWTGRRSDGNTSIFDLSALLIPLAVGVTLVTFGVAALNNQTWSKEGFSPVAYFVFGSMALLFAAGDIRMMVRGGISGVFRITRHLLRMCVALFIASGSFFLGQSQVFPDWIRKTNLLFVPAFLPLVLLLFWLIRVRFKNAYQERVIGRADPRFI